LVVDSTNADARLELSLLQDGLARVWQLEDAGLNIRVIDEPAGATGGEKIPPTVEVASSRIFLDPPVVSAALTPGTNSTSGLETNSSRVLTYLVNLIQAGDRATPYSIVSAVGAPYIPADLRTNEIVVNQWLADDLKIGRGDTLMLSYFVVDSGSKLWE